MDTCLKILASLVLVKVIFIASCIGDVTCTRTSTDIRCQGSVHPRSAH